MTMERNGKANPKKMLISNRILQQGRFSYSLYEVAWLFSDKRLQIIN
jgi:hypothetical protein